MDEPGIDRYSDRILAEGIDEAGRSRPLFHIVQAARGRFRRKICFRFFKTL